jgi:hypothetical protein
MNNLVDMLREAFNAGMSCAASYEHGTYTVDFKKWYEENKSEIESLHKLLMLSDGHRQYRRNDDDIHSNEGDRHSGFSV